MAALGSRARLQVGHAHQLALYLASDAAAFISGVEFPVDGARTV